jgi:hypothetical protein
MEHAYSRTWVCTYVYIVGVSKHDLHAFQLHIVSTAYFDVHHVMGTHPDHVWAFMLCIYIFDPYAYAYLYPYSSIHRSLFARTRARACDLSLSLPLPLSLSEWIQNCDINSNFGRDLRAKWRFWCRDRGHEDIWSIRRAAWLVADALSLLPLPILQDVHANIHILPKTKVRTRQEVRFFAQLLYIDYA